MYKVKDFWTGKDVDVELQATQYRNNGRIALQLWCEDGPYATLSVNLPDEKVNDDEFFVDTNNCPWAPAFLEKYGIATDTGYIGFSGFCMYPKFVLA